MSETTFKLIFVDKIAYIRIQGHPIPAIEGGGKIIDDFTLAMPIVNLRKVIDYLNNGLEEHSLKIGEVSCEA